jgi:hypothetical protein
MAPVVHLYQIILQRWHAGGDNMEDMEKSCELQL